MILLLAFQLCSSPPSLCTCETHQKQSCSSSWSAGMISRVIQQDWELALVEWSYSWPWLAERQSFRGNQGWFSQTYLTVKFVQNMKNASTHSWPWHLELMGKWENRGIFKILINRFNQEVIYTHITSRSVIRKQLKLLSQTQNAISHKWLWKWRSSLGKICIFGTASTANAIKCKHPTNPLNQNNPILKRQWKTL